MVAIILSFLAMCLLVPISAHSLRKHSSFSSETSKQIQLQWQAYRRNYKRVMWDELPTCEPHDITESCLRAKNAPINESTPMRLRSLSPFEYCKSENNSRFPRQITQTRCMCTECFDYNRFLQDDLQLNSEPIQVSMPVVRFSRGVSSLGECHDNPNDCNVDFINVTVGCHCVIRV